MSRPDALLASLLTLVLAGGAAAQDPALLGSWELKGSYQPTLRRTTATFELKRQGAGWQVRRVGRFTTGSPFTWTSTDVTLATGGKTMTVRWRLQGGLSGGVPGGQPNDLSATYTVGTDGKLYERVRNLTRRPPEQWWLTLQTVGPRVGPVAAAGLRSVPDLATFDRLSRRDDSPGALGVREVKLLLVDRQQTNATLWLVDTKAFQYHYDFFTRGLGRTATLERFNGDTYFTDARKHVAGTVIYHENHVRPDGTKGLFVIEFWPTDPVKVDVVNQVYRAVAAAMPFAAGRIAYHPAGETHEGLYRTERARYDQLQLPVITTADLFGNLAYQPMNVGVGFGILRVVDPAVAGTRPPSVRDVVILKRLPNDLSHTGGLITEEMQTPLSHVNLKAKQNHTPNAFIKDAANDPRLRPLIGKVVRYEVGADDFQVREATQAEADAFLESVRPANPTVPTRDLTVRTIRDLDDIGASSTSANGAKAANVAELRKLFPNTSIVPDGFAIPFWFYDRFMTANGFYDRARTMMADPAFADVAERERLLTAFRRDIRRAPVPADVATAITALQAKFPAGTAIRCRSSTNNEDLPNFNGAGLYDSYTHRADEGDLSETIKQVWASLWNFRAFEERDFYRIDHFKAAMGVLVHPNFDDEKANGVAITRNIYDPNWPGLYVNAQVGEALITNPTGAKPDEFLIAKLGPNGEWETQYVTHSDQVPAGQTVLSTAQVRQLAAALEKVQAHFKVVYQKQNDPTFAMDVEWKFDAAGRLVIKQARPVVN